MEKINFKQSALVLCVGAVLSQLPLARVFAQANTQQSSIKFIESATPPAGFETSQLDVSETNYISVYYGGKFIGNVIGVYDDNSISLKNVATLVQQIPNVKNAPAVIAALSGKLANNSDHLCPATLNNSYKPYCKVLSPKVAGVIFDMNTYRATIFINPNYLNAATKPINLAAMLPNSTAGFSYLGNNNLSASTTTGQQTYSLNNQSYFASGDNVLNIESNLTQTNTSATAGGSGNSTSTVYTLQSIALGRLNGGIYYQAGMITPMPGSFINQPTLLGVSMQNYGVVPEEAEGTPIPLFLSLPAQVAVYKNGYLISTQSFDAGNQLLNTASFPVGSYDVQLKITNNLGQTTTQTQFFVKQSQLPPGNTPNYQVSIGFLQSNQNSATNTSPYDGNQVVFPEFLAEPLFNYTEIRKLSGDLGLQSNLMSNFNRVFLTEGLTYYGISWQIMPGVLVSNNNQYGWVLNAQYNPIKFPNFSLLSSNQKIYNSSNIASNSNVLEDSNFSPVAQTTFQSNNTATLALGHRTTMSANLQVTQNLDTPTLTSYGYSLNYAVLANSLINLQLNGSITDTTGSNTTVSVGLTASFSTVNNLSVSVGAGIDNTTQITNTSNNTVSNQYQPNYNASMNKNYYWGPNNQEGLGFNAGINHYYASDTQNIATYFTNALMQGNFSFSHSITQAFTNTNGAINASASSNTQFAGNVQSNMLYSNGYWAFGYQGGGGSAAILAHLDVDNSADSKDAGADVFVNGQNMGAVQANSVSAIYLAPYQSYNVTISPTGIKQYGFDAIPKPVTLYNGNVQYLNWTLTRQYVVFAKIVNAEGKAFSNILLLTKRIDDFNVTDNLGYIQASIDADQKTLRFEEINGAICTVTLPPLHSTGEDLVVIDHALVCKA